MDERIVPVTPAEALPQRSPDGREGPGAATALDDPRALQILTTEHWSLLSARALVYNEAFTRAGMFLAFLSATLLVLGLISTATGFSDAFLAVAGIILALDLFIGLATLGRAVAVSDEDLRYLQGMNRLRHAYHEMVPGLTDYFISSHHDDFESVVKVYGTPALGRVGEILHGLTTIPATISVICCAIAAMLAAIIALLATHDGLVAGISGVGAFTVTFVVIIVVSLRAVDDFARRVDAKWPAPAEEGEAAP